MNNYMWLLVVFGLCGGGYYEYTNLQTQASADRQVLKLELQGKIDQLEASNQKLTQAQEESKTQMAFLAAQADAAQKALEMATKSPASANGSNSGIGGMSSAPSTSAATSAATSNNLGTIATLDGKTFPNSELLKVDPNGITIKCTSGITKVGFFALPPELQKRFGFDPKNGAALTDAQIEQYEAQRKAATGK